VTVVAAASSGVRVGRALPALVLGSSLFLQAHLLLGYALGPAARELLEPAQPAWPSPSSTRVAPTWLALSSPSVGRAEQPRPSAGSPGGGA
jgi:hypothetical protein